MVVTVSCEIRIPIPGRGKRGDDDRDAVSAGEDCYSNNDNVHADEPEVHVKTQGEKARYEHRGGRFGVRGKGKGSEY